MGKLSRLLAYVFVKRLFALYEAGERSGGRVPWSALIEMAAIAGGFAGGAFLLALMRGSDPGEWASTGAIAGLMTYVAWLVISIVVTLVFIFVTRRSSGAPDHGRRREG